MPAADGLASVSLKSNILESARREGRREVGVVGIDFQSSWQSGVWVNETYMGAGQLFPLMALKPLLPQYRFIVIMTSPFLVREEVSNLHKSGIL